MKVYYDDKCSLCKREINYYKKKGFKNIKWLGIHKNEKILDFRKITKEDYLKRMHVIDDDNQIKVGVDAFIAIWKKDSRFNYLAKIVGFLPIKIFASLIYTIFAYIRYKNLYNSKK